MTEPVGAVSPVSALEPARAPAETPASDSEGALVTPLGPSQERERPNPLAPSRPVAPELALPAEFGASISADGELSFSERSLHEGLSALYAASVGGMAPLATLTPAQMMRFDRALESIRRDAVALERGSDFDREWRIPEEVGHARHQRAAVLQLRAEVIGALQRAGADALAKSASGLFRKALEDDPDPFLAPFVLDALTRHRELRSLAVVGEAAALYYPERPPEKWFEDGVLDVGAYVDDFAMPVGVLPTLLSAWALEHGGKIEEVDGDDRVRWRVHLELEGPDGKPVPVRIHVMNARETGWFKDHMRFDIATAWAHGGHGRNLSRWLERVEHQESSTAIWAFQCFGFAGAQLARSKLPGAPFMATRGFALNAQHLVAFKRGIEGVIARERFEDTASEINRELEGDDSVELQYEVSSSRDSMATVLDQDDDGIFDGGDDIYSPGLAFDPPTLRGFDPAPAASGTTVETSTSLSRQARELEMLLANQWLKDAPTRVVSAGTDPSLAGDRAFGFDIRDDGALIVRLNPRFARATGSTLSSMLAVEASRYLAAELSLEAERSKALTLAMVAQVFHQRRHDEPRHVLEIPAIEYALLARRYGLPALDVHQLIDDMAGQRTGRGLERFTREWDERGLLDFENASVSPVAVDLEPRPGLDRWALTGHTFPSLKGVPGDSYAALEGMSLVEVTLPGLPEHRYDELTPEQRRLRDRGEVYLGFRGDRRYLVVSGTGVDERTMIVELESSSVIDLGSAYVGYMKGSPALRLFDNQAGGVATSYAVRAAVEDITREIEKDEDIPEWLSGVRLRSDGDSSARDGSIEVTRIADGSYELSVGTLATRERFELRALVWAALLRAHGRALGLTTDVIEAEVDLHARARASGLVFSYFAGECAPKEVAASRVELPEGFFDYPNFAWRVGEERAKASIETLLASLDGLEGAQATHFQYQGNELLVMVTLPGGERRALVIGRPFERGPMRMAVFEGVEAIDLGRPPWLSLAKPQKAFGVSEAPAELTPAPAGTLLEQKIDRLMRANPEVELELLSSVELARGVFERWGIAELEPVLVTGLSVYLRAADGAIYSLEGRESWDRRPHRLVRIETVSGFLQDAFRGPGLVGPQGLAMTPDLLQAFDASSDVSDARADRRAAAKRIVSSAARGWMWSRRVDGARGINYPPSAERPFELEFADTFDAEGEAFRFERVYGDPDQIRVSVNERVAASRDFLATEVLAVELALFLASEQGLDDPRPYVVDLLRDVLLGSFSRMTTFDKIRRAYLMRLRYPVLHSVPLTAFVDREAPPLTPLSVSEGAPVQVGRREHISYDAVDLIGTRGIRRFFAAHFPGVTPLAVFASSQGREERWFVVEKDGERHIMTIDAHARSAEVNWLPYEPAFEGIAGFRPLRAEASGAPVYGNPWGEELFDDGPSPLPDRYLLPSPEEFRARASGYYQAKPGDARMARFRFVNDGSIEMVSYELNDRFGSDRSELERKFLEFELRRFYYGQKGVAPEKAAWQALFEVRRFAKPEFFLMFAARYGLPRDVVPKLAAIRGVALREDFDAAVADLPAPVGEPRLVGRELAFSPHPPIGRIDPRFGPRVSQGALRDFVKSLFPEHSELRVTGADPELPIVRGRGILDVRVWFGPRKVSWLTVEVGPDARPERVFVVE